MRGIEDQDYEYDEWMTSNWHYDGAWDYASQNGAEAQYYVSELPTLSSSSGLNAVGAESTPTTS